MQVMISLVIGTINLVLAWAFVFGGFSTHSDAGDIFLPSILVPIVSIFGAAVDIYSLSKKTNMSAIFGLLVNGLAFLISIYFWMHFRLDLGGI